MVNLECGGVGDAACQPCAGGGAKYFLVLLQIMDNYVPLSPIVFVFCQVIMLSLIKQKSTNWIVNQINPLVATLVSSETFLNLLKTSSERPKFTPF